MSGEGATDATELSDDLAALLNVHRRGGPLILLFDYDGTLVPFASRPEGATLPPETRVAVERLAQMPRVHVGILSGRALDDLVSIVNLAVPYFAGTSGLELLLRGRRVTHPDADTARGPIAALAQTVADALAPHAGAWVERKPLGFAVHYRAVPGERVAAVRRAALEALAPAREIARVVSAPCALEITAALGWTKGTAVERIVEDAVRGDGKDRCGLVYAGDAENDADAFAAVRAREGVTVGVGADAPADARHRLADAHALGEVIAALAARLEMHAAGAKRR
jgi:trehalose-phosphatase